MHAKISHYSATIGRRDDAGRSWLCPADSTSKHSGGNDTSGSCSHNSESSGEKAGNGNPGSCPADYAKTKVQLRAGNEHRQRPWKQPEKAVSGSGLESGSPGNEGRRGGLENASDGR